MKVNMFKLLLLLNLIVERLLSILLIRLELIVDGIQEILENTHIFEVIDGVIVTVEVIGSSAVVVI